MDKIRAFIAVPLPRELLEQLASLRRRLEARTPSRSVGWVRPEGIHLTLKFLGDIPTAQIPDLDQALKVVSRHAPGCTFVVEGLGCFPNSRRARIVWVGVREPTGRLAALQDGVEEAMTHFGFEPEGRGFSPHLTLGRVRRKTPSRQVALVGEEIEKLTVGVIGQVQADRFALIRSVLKPTGAEYTTLHVYQLGGNGAK
jgi:2'-5' RNA ligase